MDRHVGDGLGVNLTVLLIVIFLQILVATGVQVNTECGSPHCSLAARRNFGTLSRYSQGDAPVVSSEPFITAADTQFGAQIEAASVDKSGCIFATDFTGLRSSLGRISSADEFVEQHLFFNASSVSPAFFNGLRFLPTRPSAGVTASRALAADVKGHSVVLLSRNGAAEQVTSCVFCHDATMVQPNDIAIAPLSGRVYTSGQNYTSDTVIGDGDLWMCEAGANFEHVTPGSPVMATRLGVFGRTNGIEVSPDEKTLYLSEAFNRQGSVVSNKVWKFAIDQRTGYVWDQSLFVDFEQLDGTGAVDVDGMRTDVDGNLFITRNGDGEVLKFSPQGQLLLRILLPGIRTPSNLELGGANGTSLFVVGECSEGGPGKGCANIWKHNSVPGRAFRDLNSH